MQMLQFGVLGENIFILKWRPFLAYFKFMNVKNIT